MLKTVILAAGKGTRMESELPKVVHAANDKMMVAGVIEAAVGAGATELCLVVGHQGALVQERVDEVYAGEKGFAISYAMQTEQLGTGHAVKCAKDFIGDEGDVLVLCGDTPLIQAETLKKLVDTHRREGNGATVLSAILPDATGYGRIIRTADGAFARIVEQKDATEEELLVREINSGMYVFSALALSESLDMLTNHNVQGEYYLTDTLELIGQRIGKRVNAVVTENLDDIRGVNTKAQLAEAEEILKRRAARQSGRHTGQGFVR